MRIPDDTHWLEYTAYQSITNILKAHPFPVPGDIRRQYYSLIDPELLRKLHIMMSDKIAKQALLDKSYGRLVLADSDAHYTIIFHFDEPIPVFSTNPHKVWVHEDSPHYTKVLAWCREVAATKKDIEIAERHINAILRTATTTGHIHRILPELSAILPEKYKQAIDGAKKASPYPRTWIEDGDARARHKITSSLITKALLAKDNLPVVKAKLA